MQRLLIILTIRVSLIFSHECQVTIKNGTINGYITGTLNPKKKVCAYTSIPYATPPVGPLRFQGPSPLVQGWDILEATRLPNWCPQVGSPPEGVEISEDCLYLNVYQPKVILKKGGGDGLPVMIWIHGGGFTTGSSFTHTPTKLLARADVILVVIHYRLGILGFFSTGDSHIPGNNGLKDQALAIRWVQENIRSFGGNPGQVTIFGGSAGAASAVYHLISPLNKGLIHGVIAQSGTALSSWAIDRNPEESSKMMAQRLKCPVATKLMMVSCLRKLSWQKIVKEQNAYRNECFQMMKYPTASIAPVIEPENCAGAVITEDPEIILRSGDFPDIPVIMGATKHEGSLFLGQLYMAKIGPQNLSRDGDYMKHGIVPDLLKFVDVRDPDPGQRVVASSVETAFLCGVNRSSWKESMPGLVDILSVFLFKASIQNTAEILSGMGRKVYLYSFEHHSKNTLFPWLDPANEKSPIAHGIAHVDELLYLFDLPGRFSRQDEIFSELFSDMWLNFGRYGTPTPFPDQRFGIWLPYNVNDEPFMKLNVTPTLMHGYRKSWRPNGFSWN